MRLFNINHTPPPSPLLLTDRPRARKTYVLPNECCLRRQSRRHFSLFDAHSNIRLTCVSMAQTFAVCLVMYASQSEWVLSVRWICQVSFNRWVAAASNNNIQVYFHLNACTELVWRKSSTQGNQSVSGSFEIMCSIHDYFVLSDFNRYAVFDFHFTAPRTNHRISNWNTSCSSSERFLISQWI